MIKRIIIYKGYKENIERILEILVFSVYHLMKGMPKSVLEASAAGIPSIVTNTVGCKEAVINNKTGLLVNQKIIKIYL